MSDQHELVVWLGSAQAGTLEEAPSGELTFSYAPAYLAAEAATPISLALPLRADPYPNPQCRPYFANLLPDAGLLEAVAHKLGLSADNHFGLLEALGGECAGAVSLMPPGQEPGKGGKYERLSQAQFDRLIEELPHRPLLAGERGIRLSLAGAQKKVALRYRDGIFSLAKGALATTHILKPGIGDFKDTVRNEALCMALAGRLGLPVPKSWVHPGPSLVYVVERFDRRVGADGTVIRLHTEDFCQATGRPPSKKYQVEGGPGFAECFDLISRWSSSPQPDNLALLRLAVFNVLIYNADAHGKNLSLLHDNGAVRLAPFYDLMTTRIYGGLETDMAMWIGEKRKADEVLRRHWEAFADQVGVGRREVFATLKELAGPMPTVAGELAADQASRFGPSMAIDDLVRGVNHRCRLALRQVELPSRSR